MNDRPKTYQALTAENAALKERIRELEAAEAERRQAEDVLHDSEKLYRSLIECSSDAIFCVDKKGQYQFVNTLFTTTFGKSPDYFKGKTFWDIYPKDHADYRFATTQRVFKTGESESIEVEVPLPDKTLFFYATANPIKDETGKVVMVLTHAVDITDRKRAEAALKEERERYRNFIRNASEGIYRIDFLPPVPIDLSEQELVERLARNAVVGEVNESLACMYGLTAADMIGRRAADFAPTYGERALLALRAPNFQVRDQETEDINPNGQTVSLMENFTGVVEDGHLIHIWGMQRDITDRKKADEALQESEEKYRVLVEAAGEAIFIAQDGIIRFCNQSFSDISGYESTELVNMAFSDLVHPDDRQMIFDRYIQRLEGKDVPSRYRFRFVDARGNTRWADMSVALISWKGKPASLCLAADITELKQAEEALNRSEDKYRHLFESAMEGILVARGDTLEFVNPALERILGYPLKKITSEPFVNFIHPDDRAMVVDRHLRRMRGESVEEGYDFRIIDSHGAVRWLTIHSQVIQWEGAPANLSFLADITERKRAEDHLRRSQQLFSTIFHANPAAVILSFLSNGKCVDANEAYARLTGYEREELIGKTTMELNIWTSSEERQRVVAELAEKGHLENVELTLRRKNGELIHTIAGGEVINLEGQRYILSFFLDITERKQAEEEREKLQTHLTRAQKLESVGTLAGGIAHDFNNLLMAIQGHASLMMLDLDPSDPRHVRLKHIEGLIQSGADLNGQLLGFARGGRYEVKPVSMNDIVEKSSAMFGRTKKEITIHQKYAQDPCIVEVDRSQMEQVFMNLFVNAWQAMPGGGDMFIETEKVVLDEIRAMPVRVAPGQYVKVTVTDTGTGMDEQTKERIFDPFFTTKSMGRGTGLGLATVYGIMRGHGGMITAESESGQGSTFTLYVPASGKDPDEERKPAEGVLRGTEGILLVDDEKMVLEVSRDLVESLGYRVYAAGSGQEAVAVYMEKRNNIDLVILDMVMPGISGSETFDRLREIDHDVKVLLASGYSIDGQAQVVLDHGCKGFLQKPFRLEELSRRIRKVLD